MKAARSTDAPKAFVLKQIERGKMVAEVCREAWISSATYFNCKKNSGMLPSDMRQLRSKSPKQRMKTKLRKDRSDALRPVDLQPMDFVHVQLASGCNLRVLPMVETFSRVSPIIVPKVNCKGEDVVAALDPVCR